jgi:hypothetical protein
MKLTDLVNELGLEVKSASGRLGNEVSGGYTSDLLSDVIAHGNDGDIWITLQTHLNIVAVASMKNLAGIILVNGRQPEEDTIERAEAEDVPIMVSPLTTFELVGRLYNLGIRPAGERRANEVKSD